MANNKPDENEENKTEEENEKIVVVRKSTTKIEVLKIGTILLCSHLIGVAALFVTTNKAIHDHLFSFGINTQTGIFYSVAFIAFVSLITPKILRLNVIDAQYLNIVVLLELGTMLLSVGMLNFSLGFFLCVFIAPFAIAVNLNESAKKNLFTFLIKSFLHLFFHPVSVIFGVILALSYSTFSEMSVNYIWEKSFAATIDAITYAVVDSLVR